MEASSGNFIPYAITERRSDDAAISITDPAQAAQSLGWRTRRGPEEICQDSKV